MYILKIIALFIVFLLHNVEGRTEIEIIEESESSLIFEIKRSVKTHADLAENYVFIGLPTNTYPKISIVSIEKLESHLDADQKGSYYYQWTSLQKHQNLYIAILQINPLYDQNKFIKNITLKLDFDREQEILRSANANEAKLLSKKVLNWNTAKKWFNQNQSSPRSHFIHEQGQWISFDISNDGVKKISYSDLIEAFEDLDSIDPRSIMIFTSNELGRAKKYEMNIPIPENLIELPIMIEGENDSIFNFNDKIIFYGQGPSGFDYLENEVKWNQNLYFNSSKYWIFFPEDESLRGKRILLSDDPSSVDILLDYGISHYHNEVDIQNPDLSGLSWYGPRIQNGSTQIISTNTPNAKDTFDFNIKLRLRGFSSNGSINTYHSVDLHANSISQNKIGSTLSWSGNSTRTITGTISGSNLNQNVNNFFISNLSPDDNSNPLIDFLSIKYGRKLLFESTSFDFFLRYTILIIDLFLIIYYPIMLMYLIFQTLQIR